MNLSLSRVYVNFKCGHNMQIPFAFHVMSSLGKKHQYHWSCDLEKRHLSLCTEQSWPCRLVQHLCSTEQPVHVTRPRSLQVTLDPITTQPRRKMPDNYKFCFNPLYPEKKHIWIWIQGKERTWALGFPLEISRCRPSPVTFSLYCTICSSPHSAIRAISCEPFHIFNTFFSSLFNYRNDWTTFKELYLVSAS